MARLGRLGLAARGLLYVLLAYLAFRVAAGQPQSRTTDPQGALQTVARQHYGHLLLAALAFGFGAYGVWQLAIAFLGDAARAGSDKASKRVVALVNGVLYGSLCISAIALATGSSRSRAKGGNKAEVDATNKVMQHTFGRTLIGIVGVALIVIGLVLVWRAFSGERELELQPVSRTVRKVVDVLAKVGLTAQAVVIIAAGVFVTRAAIAFDPKKAQGLDGILKSFAHTSAGPPLLVVVALGLLAYGAYSLALARYAEI